MEICSIKEKSLSIQGHHHPSIRANGGSESVGAEEQWVLQRLINKPDICAVSAEELMCSD